MQIVYLVASWFVGLWLASAIELDMVIWLLMAGIGFAGALLGRRAANMSLLLACLCAAGLAGARYKAAVPPIDESHIAYYNGARQITITGLVVDEPDIRDRFINLRLAVEEMVLSDETRVPVHGHIQVQTFRFPVIEYGTRIQVSGRLETPPENEEFSYKDYLARQGIHSLISLPDMTVLATGQGHPIYHGILALKQQAQATINHLIPDPQAALLTGILLGDDNGLPPELAEAFRTTGMTHIIAISGFNIAILVALSVGIGELFFSRRGAVIFAAVIILFYTILVGADASVVRAALMGGTYLIATRWLGRPNFAYASLFLAGFMMTLLRPFTLWDVGFQLSFMATLSLILFADPFTQWMRARLQKHVENRLVKPIMGLITESIIITLAAQVLTLPLMVGYFGQLSLISLPANALILPAQPAVMIFGGLATIGGMILPVVGQLFGWIVWLCLSYTIYLVRLFAAVPGAAVPVNISGAGVIGIYALITAVTWWRKQDSALRARWWGMIKQNLTHRLSFGTTFVAAVLVFSWGISQPDGQLHIVFMNVGQGDATFIQTPTGRQILIDGGFYPSVLNDQLGRQMPFWDKAIDIVVATHPDADHVSGLVGVFERYQVAQLITDGEGLGESPIYDAVLTAAEEQKTSIRPALAGELIEIGDGIRLEILHPGPELNREQRNENSVSMRLVYGTFTFLFTGDAEQQAEQTMLQNGRPLQAIVFKAGHHGSNSSSSADFLQAVRPQIIIVSAGKDNRFGHPHPEMLQRARDVGAAVLRTDELGTIELTTDGHTMWWQATP